MMECLPTEKNERGFSTLSTSHSIHLAAWLFPMVIVRKLHFFLIKKSGLFKWDSKHLLLPEKIEFSQIFHQLVILLLHFNKL